MGSDLRMVISLSSNGTIKLPFIITFNENRESSEKILTLEEENERRMKTILKMGKFFFYSLRDAFYVKISQVLKQQIYPFDALINYKLFTGLTKMPLQKIIAHVIYMACWFQDHRGIEGFQECIYIPREIKK